MDDGRNTQKQKLFPDLAIVASVRALSRSPVLALSLWVRGPEVLQASNLVLAATDRYHGLTTTLLPWLTWRGEHP